MKLSTANWLIVLLAVDLAAFVEVSANGSHLQLASFAVPALNVLLLVGFRRRGKAALFLAIGGATSAAYLWACLARYADVLPMMQYSLHRLGWYRLLASLYSAIEFAPVGPRLASEILDWFQLVSLAMAISTLLLIPAFLAHLLFRQRPEVDS